MIYGANDGLAAVFGLVAGFSGATGGSHLVLTAGLFGAIGSALSMATGAYLAERSTAEVAAANLAREREEVLAHPEEEKEELSLYYQLKGLTEAEADMLVARIAEDPEKLFAAIAVEELGSADAERGDPIEAALAGGLSTALGAIVPVLPFFWLSGDRRRDRRRRGLARRALRGRRGEVAVHAAQRLVGGSRDDARRRRRRRRDIPARPRHRHLTLQASVHGHKRAASRYSHVMEGPSDADRVGHLAARVLADLHAVVFGERPLGVRSWCDGSALLVVLGLGAPGRAGETARDAMPELVAASVAARTGWRLRAGNWAASRISVS